MRRLCKISWPNGWKNPHPDLDKEFEEEKDIVLLETDVIKPKKRNLFNTIRYALSKKFNKIFKRTPKRFEW